MSKSFSIVNGDLQIGAGRSFNLVSGQAKLLQDLRLWVLERIGTDPSTPTYGSKLDGGFDDNGQEIPSFIGQIIGEDIMNQVRNEIIDLLQHYQAMQYEKIRAETIQYLGKNTLDRDEVLESIDSVEVRSIGTTVLVRVFITTLAGSSLRLTLPVTP